MNLTIAIVLPKLSNTAHSWRKAKDMAYGNVYSCNTEETHKRFFFGIVYLL